MKEAIRRPGLIGTFGRPDDNGPHPGVLALTGSGGGAADWFIEMLVPAGFATLSLAYFAGPAAPDLAEHGLPPNLVEIPLERIERGLRFLIERADVRTHDGRVGVIGVSKGGELALLLAATFPELVGPVVAYTPSSVVWQGVTWSGGWDGRRRSSWTLDGEPVPFVPYPDGLQGTHSDRGLAIAAIYDKGLDQFEDVERAAIPVEQARGPVMVISGGDDQMWPADRMCRALVERMEHFGRAGDITHLNYPDAGHILAPEGWPPTRDGQLTFDFGGSLEATAAADADARPKIIEHLRG